MTLPPGHREFTQQELAYTSRDAALRADRRTVALEARLADIERRMAEKDQIISELREGFAKQAEAISAMSVVVRELQGKMDRGVEQVVAGLEAKLSQHIGDMDALTLSIEERVKTLETKRRGGRPKGSKNKPKPQSEGSGDVPAEEEA